jgi:hypothetical protein
MGWIDRSVIRCRWYQKVPDFPSFASSRSPARRSALRARKPNEFLAVYSLTCARTLDEYTITDNHDIHMHLSITSSLLDLELHVNTDYFCIHMSNDRRHEADRSHSSSPTVFRRPQIAQSARTPTSSPSALVHSQLKRARNSYGARPSSFSSAIFATLTRPYLTELPMSCAKTSL